MFKNILPVVFIASVLLSCYPLGTFQGPEVLPNQTESVGIGLGWMTNINAFQDSSSNADPVFFADASLLFRRGLGHNTDIGLKFVGRPWVRGSLMTDVKYQLLQQPVKVAVDIGLSYWSGLSRSAYIGYHPALIAGGDRLFIVGQYNYIRSQFEVIKTQDFLIGRHFSLLDSEYTLTPFLGFHHSEDSPGEIVYSFGFGFTRPLIDRSIRH